MSGKIFLDTNLWIYLYAKDSPEKYQKVEEIIKNKSPSLVVSTQVLGELFHVLTRKNLTLKTEAINIVSDIIRTFPVQAIDTSHVLLSLEINTKYNYSDWDSLIIANDCRYTAATNRSLLRETLLELAGAGLQNSVHRYGNWKTLGIGAWLWRFYWTLAA